MTGVRAATGMSERRVCRVLGQARSTQRYTVRRREEEAPLLKRIHELVRAHPRRGYRMICGMLRLEGWRVNAKRIDRLGRKMGQATVEAQQKMGQATFGHWDGPLWWPPGPGHGPQKTQAFVSSRLVATPPSGRGVSSSDPRKCRLSHLWRPWKMGLSHFRSHLGKHWSECDNAPPPGTGDGAFEGDRLIDPVQRLELSVVDDGSDPPRRAARGRRDRGRHHHHHR